MRYLTTSEILELHRLVIERTGGSPGVRDMNLLESATAQPAMVFGGEELYPTFSDKAAALAFSVIMNHPFVDGNKRAGHAAMETFLVLRNYLMVTRLMLPGMNKNRSYCRWPRERLAARTLRIGCGPIWWKNVID